MKTGVFELAATQSKSLDAASLELSGSNENSGISKTSEDGVLRFDISVPCGNDFRADLQLDKQCYGFAEY